MYSHVINIKVIILDLHEPLPEEIEQEEENLEKENEQSDNGDEEVIFFINTSFFLHFDSVKSKISDPTSSQKWGPPIE
jgi:hypothetical protein